MERSTRSVVLALLLTCALATAAVAQDRRPPTVDGDRRSSVQASDDVLGRRDQLRCLIGGEDGIDLGRRVARKHLGWYMDDLQTDIRLRKQILTEPDHGKVPGLLRQLVSVEQRRAA